MTALAQFAALLAIVSTGVILPRFLVLRPAAAVELLMFARRSPVGTHVFEDEVLGFA